MLNQDTRDNESLNAIGNYIQNRFQHFWDVTDNSLIHEYEEHISSSANKNHNSHDSLIHEYAPVILEIMENLTADIEENKFGFHFKTNKNYFYTGLLLFTEIMIKRMNLSVEDYCILSKKNFLSLGYYEDDIEINKNGRGKFGKAEINDLAA